MGAWPEHTFSGIGTSYGGDGSTWDKVDDFKIGLNNTAYDWCSCSRYNSGQLWNVCVAMVLVIEKCNSLQAQIDGMGATEFTMETLINTMLVADPEEVTYFIGLVDAYRTSIWNKPYNSEFYAALARGFETWE